MPFLNGMDISTSGLTAQRARLDVISENIANIDTTRTEDGKPYTRKYVVLQERNPSFASTLQKTAGEESAVGGVRVAEVGEDQSAYKLK